MATTHPLARTYPFSILAALSEGGSQKQDEIIVVEGETVTRYYQALDDFGGPQIHQEDVARSIKKDADEAVKQQGAKREIAFQKAFENYLRIEQSCGIEANNIPGGHRELISDNTRGLLKKQRIIHLSSPER